jgi:hypothetical protein
MNHNISTPTKPEPSQAIPVFYLKPDVSSVFRWNLLMWAQYKELVSVSKHHININMVYKANTSLNPIGVVAGARK